MASTKYKVSGPRVQGSKHATWPRRKEPSMLSASELQRQGWERDVVDDTADGSGQIHGNRIVAHKTSHGPRTTTS